MTVCMYRQVQPPQTKASIAAAKSGGGAYHGVWSSLYVLECLQRVARFWKRHLIGPIVLDRVRMYKEEGLRGYMKGNGVNCARVGGGSSTVTTSNVVTDHDVFVNSYR